MDELYGQVLNFSAAVLGIKMVAIHLLTARERMMSKDFSQKEDANATGASISVPLFSMALLAFGPSLADTDRLERIALNNVVNEPYFLAVAVIGGLTGTIPPVTGATLITYFTYARIAHNFFFVSKLTVPRALTYTVGAFSALGLSALALGAKF
eukprot:m.56006 g.56006  ORF g.56006 m.56006 type:complete len:154 (+) comp15558_c0_seq1:68-529(+)